MAGEAQPQFFVYNLTSADVCLVLQCQSADRSESIIVGPKYCGFVDREPVTAEDKKPLRIAKWTIYKLYNPSSSHDGFFEMER